MLFDTSSHPPKPVGQQSEVVGVVGIYNHQQHLEGSLQELHATVNQVISSSPYPLRVKDKFMILDYEAGKVRDHLCLTHSRCLVVTINHGYCYRNEPR